jgi:hypothetical protein
MSSQIEKNVLTYLQATRFRRYSIRHRIVFLSCLISMELVLMPLTTLSGQSATFL